MKNVGVEPETTKESGQVLLIGVLLLLVLLIAVPAMIFLNQHAASHGVISQKRLRGQAIAEEGMAFATQQLTALGAPWPPSSAILSGMGFDGTKTFQSSQGQGSFKITCNLPATIPSLQIYQMQIIARPYDAQGKLISGSSIQTTMSQRTIGAKLPTGLAASAAVELGLVPNIGSATGDFLVHWGPIVLLDPNNAWTITDAPSIQGMNAYQFPRKFAVGGLTQPGGSTAAPGNTDAAAVLTRCAALPCTTTDQQEYWAYTSPGFSNPINLTAYQALAVVVPTPPIPQPNCLVGGASIPATPLGSGYFDLTTNCVGGTAEFPAGYTVPNLSTVIYINGGNAQLDNGVQIDMKQGGAFIVTATPAAIGGNLTVNGAARVTTANQTNIRIPPTQALEYPYKPGWWTAWGIVTSCGAIEGVAQCGLPFRGFLYVEGNMIVTNNSNFAMSGVLRVDGQLQVPDANTFWVFYDDQINHSIQPSNFELQVHSSTAIGNL